MPETNQGTANYVETNVEIRVTYGEVDRMGVAYYGNYLRWFEVGRGEYLRVRGKPYKQIETEGLRLPVIEAHVRYREPAGYDDLIQVRTIPAQVDQVRVKFGYQVVRKADGTLLADGYTVHACLGPSGHARRFPRPLLEILENPPNSKPE